MNRDIRVIAKPVTYRVEYKPGLTNTGGGDMYRATYDSDGDNIVDHSENSLKLGGYSASDYLKNTDHLDCGTF